ncbi:hypothetical protein C5167_050089 [Papaver somniferum]|uniref:Uncharacterized protein n=1 Tax=Papaver somniferum TaxID=3469 RepID=A0A4Y7KR24_PAPSO|nr:hypothetical protein C5167_050089 [Papaver somniferum]
MIRVQSYRIYAVEIGIKPQRGGRDKLTRQQFYSMAETGIQTHTYQGNRMAHNRITPTTVKKLKKGMCTPREDHPRMRSVAIGSLGNWVSLEAVKDSRLQQDDNGTSAKISEENLLRPEIWGCLWKFRPRTRRSGCDRVVLSSSMGLIWNRFLLGILGCELDSLMVVNQAVKVQLVPSREARLEANSNHWYPFFFSTNSAGGDGIIWSTSPGPNITTDASTIYG